MENALPKILSVEDDRATQSLYAELLKDTAHVLAAMTVEDGFRLFKEHPDIRIVVMDGDVPNDGMLTYTLTGEIRRAGFTGPMIASSSSQMFRDLLIAYGCDQAAAKSSVPEIVTALLARTP